MMAAVVRRSLTVVAVLFAAAGPLAAQMPPAAGGMQGQGIDMPDARQMSGMPLPAGELAPGTVTVRVVRGAMTNPLPKQTVTIIGAEAPPLETNESGRAEFTGLPVGAKLKAVVTVEGQRIESQEFTVPPTGGMRMMLVALDPEMAKRAEEDRKLAQGPARQGIVVLGDQSRFVFEIGEEGLNVFNIFEIQNTARTPVNPPVPVVFDLPPGAEHAAVLEGSSPLAAVEGRQVLVKGPFPPGMTLVQFAYTMPHDGAVTISQRLPAALAQVTILAQQVGDLKFTSNQVGAPSDMHAEGGHYLVAQGPPLAAGSEVTVAFEGLPSVPTWPRNLALALAIAVLIGGAFAAFKGPHAAGVKHERSRLESARERLFEQLTALEAAQRSGSIDQHTYDTRRRDLVVSLERIYAALDEDVAA